MDKLKMHTPDKAEENFRKLAELFPDAVTETVDENGEVVRAIDKDVLMQEISAKVIDGAQERYQFTWPDKRKSVVLANAPIAKTLRLQPGKSVGRDGTAGLTDSDNIYIEGDNLDALKLLQETYLGKVKMIYIDPLIILATILYTMIHSNWMLMITRITVASLMRKVTSSFRIQKAMAGSIRTG